MGTTGTGRLTDYSRNGGGGGSDGEGGGAGGGGGRPSDPCGEAFIDRLEEVARSAYFLNHDALPPINESVEVKFANRRMAVVAQSSGELIGYLPTNRNYLRGCIDDHGHLYTGAVVVSTMPSTSIPHVEVSITP